MTKKKKEANALLFRLESSGCTENRKQWKMAESTLSSLVHSSSSSSSSSSDQRSLRDF